MNNTLAALLLTISMDTGLDNITVSKIYCHTPLEKACYVRTNKGKHKMLSHQRYAEKVAGQPVEVLYTEYSREVGQTKIYYIKRLRLADEIERNNMHNLVENNIYWNR